MTKTSFKKVLSVILCFVLVASTALFTGCTDEGIVGEGEKSFVFTVTDKEGNETEFEIRTDKTYVGEALLENELIEGEESDFGLYVKTVNGITADYEVDGTYWAFYINGEYALTGGDTTEIVDGATYSFKVE